MQNQKLFLRHSVNKVILEISSKRLGAVAVIDKNKLVGIITDGDLRRMLQNKKSMEGLQAKDIMNKKPKTVDKSMMAIDALQLMKLHNITQVVVSHNNKFIGFVHLHDLLREGLV